MPIYTEYEVKVYHPTIKSYNATFIFSVIDNKDGTLSVKNDTFGYSKAYRTESHREAIRNMLKEHGCERVYTIGSSKGF